MMPRGSPTTHTENLGGEVCIYEWTRHEVHALNATAARVWELCDGNTSEADMAARLRDLRPGPSLGARGGRGLAGPGQALLALMANTVAARQPPDRTMPILRATVLRARAIESRRGEAQAVVGRVLVELV